MAIFLNHNCSAAAKQVNDERLHKNNLISMCSLRINFPPSISPKAINNNLNKTNKHVHHLNNSKLGNVRVLTATSTIVASNKYSDELAFTLTQKL